MNILYVVGRFPAASETFIAEEIKGVRARGFNVTVAALARPDEHDIAKMGSGLKSMVGDTIFVPRFDPTVLRLLARAKEVWRLNRRLSREATKKVHPIIRLLRAMAVADLVDRTQADLIHAHWPRPTEVALLASLMAGVPLGVSIHAHEVAHDAGHFAAVFERASFATFCNRAAMDHLLGRLGPAVRNRAHLLYHGVDLAQFEPVPMPAIEGRLDIVTAGRLTPTKGVDRLIRAIAETRRQGHNVTLTVIGEGGQRGFLEELARDLDVASIVTFTGWIKHESMCQFLARGHVFALLADDGFHDGLPNVVLEAMALGRPAILSPLPAAREVIEQSKNGFILPKIDDTDEFVAICARLLNHPEQLRALGHEARCSVSARFERGPLLDELCTLFSLHGTSPL